MEKNTFELFVKPYGGRTRYRISVVITYQTSQVIRFKVTGGIKSFELEKILVRKTNQWKVRSGSFQNIPNDHPKKVMEGVLLIQNALDDYLKQHKVV